MASSAWLKVKQGCTGSPYLAIVDSLRADLCCVQVELGGWLGERSWLRPFADALGWVDAYVERMLMAVILVKDEVSWRCRAEQRMLDSLSIC
jgi:hypothetical protein